MSNNIGKLTTPSGEGASIEVDSNLIKINSPLEFDSKGKIRYDPNQKWFAIQNHYPDGDLDKGPFILFTDGDKYPDDHTSSYQNGTVTICARSKDESNKTTLSLINREEKKLTLNNILNGVSTISVIDSVLNQGNNHVQYTSGLLVYFANTVITKGSLSKTITFEIPFINDSYAISLTSASSGNVFVKYTSKTATAIDIAVHDQNNNYDWNRTVSMIIIGKWK